MRATPPHPIPAAVGSEIEQHRSMLSGSAARWCTVTILALVTAVGWSPGTRGEQGHHVESQQVSRLEAKGEAPAPRGPDFRLLIFTLGSAILGLAAGALLHPLDRRTRNGQSGFATEPTLSERERAMQERMRRLADTQVGIRFFPELDEAGPEGAPGRSA